VRRASMGIANLPWCRNQKVRVPPCSPLFAACHAASALNEVPFWTVPAFRGGPAAPPVEGLTLRVSGLSAGAYRCEWWDTRRGAVVAREDLDCDGAALDLAAPAFTGDLAVSVRATTAGG